MWVSLKVVLTMQFCSTRGEKTFSNLVSNLQSSVSLEGFELCNYSFNRKYLKPQKSHLVIEAMQKNIFLRVAIYIYIHTHTHTHDGLGCSCFHCCKVQDLITLQKLQLFCGIFFYIYFKILPDNGFITGQMCNHVVQQSSFILPIKVVLSQLTPFLIL